MNSGENKVAILFVTAPDVLYWIEIEPPMKHMTDHFLL